MSVSIYGVTGKSVKAVLLGEKVDVRLGRFVCMDNGFFESDKKKRFIRKAESNYMRSRPAKYFVDDVQGDASGISGSVVYEIPEGYSGVHRDYEIENFKEIGTLLSEDLGNGKIAYRIETDLNTVEQLRREQEFQQMEAGLMFKGKHGNDVESYKEALKAKDEGSPTGMFTRQHGIY